MLSLPDFDEKQILIIESFDTKNINFENDNLVIKEGNLIKNKISLYKILRSDYNKRTHQKISRILSDFSFDEEKFSSIFGYLK